MYFFPFLVIVICWLIFMIYRIYKALVLLYSTLTRANRPNQYNENEQPPPQGLSRNDPPPPQQQSRYMKFIFVLNDLFFLASYHSCLGIGRLNKPFPHNNNNNNKPLFSAPSRTQWHLNKPTPCHIHRNPKIPNIVIIKNGVILEV
jgi:hypothetical protein